MDFREFTPNKEILETLMTMGISRYVAEMALFNTGNQCCDAAISYVFDNPEYSDYEPPKSMEKPKKMVRKGRNEDAADSTDEDSAEKEQVEIESTKMVFVVNMALEMGAGKTAAQVAHACLGLYRNLSQGDQSLELEDWEVNGEKKIVLGGEHRVHLMTLKEQANTLGLYNYLVQDAGRTEIAAGSITVLAIFGKEEIVDMVTGKLSLLK